ncbi:MAG: hypothetical protein WDM94_08685 [Bauldia sp.]
MKMRIGVGLTVAACAAFASAGHAADLSTPVPTMAPAASGHEVFFDGSLAAVYSANSASPWSAVISGRATVLSSSGWGASITGIDQASLSGVSVNVVGGQVDVFKNFGAGALGASYAIASGNGITISGVGFSGALFAGNAQLRGSITHSFASAPVPALTSVTGQIAYYFTPNTEGYVGVAQAWNDASASGTSFSVGAEHKFQSSPFSVFGGLAYSTTASSLAATVGVRFTPSALSLQDFTRKVPF